MVLTVIVERSCVPDGWWRHWRWAVSVEWPWRCHCNSRTTVCLTHWHWWVLLYTVAQKFAW